MRDGWLFACFFGGLVVVALALCVGIFVAVKPLNEAACNQRGDRYGLPADYRLLSDTCYVTLPNGRQLAINQIRAVEPTAR